MEMYNISEHGSTESYLIQGTPSNIPSINPLLEQVGVMYNEGAPEFIADHGWYNATAPGYGYYCTGFELPGEWEDHRRIFVMDGPDIRYPGAETESSPYVYYTPSYGYAQSPYNPYNPYIPGAMIGVDGPVVGGQQYYTLPQYQNPVSSLSYMPVVIQPDTTLYSSIDLLDSGSSIASGGRGLKPNIPSMPSFPRKPMKQASNQPNALNRVSEGGRPYVRPNKQTQTHGNVPSAGFPSPASNVFKGRSSSGSIQTIDHLSNEKVLSHHNQLKCLSDFRPQGRGVMDNIRPWVQGRAQNDVSGSPTVSAEQNRGPRTNEPKNQLAGKAYITQARDSNAQGNIVIGTDQCNKDDFPVDYMSAKFFVIKSYSEDDVHKSIKYGVWSSTPHGNKKLESAYEDAQKKTAGKLEGCPIFLFFSVNASGQFCGVAEMIGPVDFHRDMDFWQQDKWSGSFLVKWHIIKDVPNTSLRHIILENNENKPVTNSRDTQEIMFKQGLEMLKIFKNHTMKTSLLDDFMYYENRQKIMQEEKGRLTVKRFDNPFVTAFDPPHKIDTFVEPPLNGDGKITKQNDTVVEEKVRTRGLSPRSVVTDTSIEKENSEIVAADGKDIVANLKIGSLTINPKQTDSKQLASSATAHKDSVGVVTVGSVPIKVNGFAESSDILTVGTVPLDPKALEKGGAAAEAGYQH